MGDLIDQQLLMQFTSLNTTDRDDLIKQFVELVGTGPEVAAFFLDMNHWNLQTAVCMYYDYGLSKTLSATVEHYGKLPQSLPSNTEISVTLVIRNNGQEYWPRSSELRYTSGNHSPAIPSIYTGSVPPNTCTTLTITFLTPPPGTYHSYWQMFANEQPFGEPACLQFCVDDDDVSNISRDLEMRMAIGDEMGGECVVHNNSPNNQEDIADEAECQQRLQIAANNTPSVRPPYLAHSLHWPPDNTVLDESEF